MSKNYFPIISGTLILAIVVFIVPVWTGFFGTNVVGCHMSIASAQDNPCLAQEATITAQQVIILEMQATNLANSNLTTSEPLIRQVTVEVVVTATPDSLKGNLPDGCIPHMLQEGDTPFGVAVEYDANPFLLLEANGLTEENTRLLEVGDILIVPLGNCDIEQLPTFNDELETPPAPSVTEQADDNIHNHIEILGIVNVGDLDEEGVRIRNNGATVNMTGWTLVDADGTEYAFNEQLIFSNTEITVYTRAGQDTPIALFWGLDVPLWAEGDIVSLLNERSEVQATIRLDAEAIDLE